MAEAGRVLVVAHITTVGGSVRDELFERLVKLSKMAEGEPGTFKYAVMEPREDDGKTVYVVEEYADKAAFDTHMATHLVKETNAWLASNPVFDPSIAPQVHMLEYIPSFRFTRPEIAKHPDPHVMFAMVDYIPAGLEKAIPYWKGVVETGRDDEPGTLTYGVAKDPNTVNRLCLLEAYESPEYLREVHVPSKAIEQSIANTKHLRTGLKHLIMKKRAGFLYKEE